MNESSSPISLQKIRWPLAITIAVCALFWVLKPVIALLAGSAALAYILDPVIDGLEIRGFSRSTGIGIMTAVLGVIVFLVLVLLVPAIIIELDGMGGKLVAMIDQLDLQLKSFSMWASEQTGSTVSLNLEAMKQQAPDWVATSPEFSERFSLIAKGLLTQGIGLVSALINLTLLPVFTFYLLRDWDVLKGKAFLLVPSDLKPFITRTFTEVDQRLNAFIRGQLKVCLALAGLYSVGLLVAGIKLAIPIGLISGLLFIVPYLGTVIGIALALLMSLLEYGIDGHLIAVAVVFAVSQLIEGYYLTPKIVGESVGLSPMVVMISLIVGSSLMGIWGMLLAIPVTAVLSVFASEWMQRYQNSELFSKYDQQKLSEHDQEAEESPQPSATESDKQVQPISANLSKE